MCFLFARTLHLPVRTLPSLCVYKTTSVGGYHVSVRACGACTGPSCAKALHLFARVFPVPAHVFCLHLVEISNYPRVSIAQPLRGDSPNQSWAHGGDTYNWRLTAPTLFDFIFTVTSSMHHQDLTPILPPTQHPCIPPASTTHSAWWNVSEIRKIVLPKYCSRSNHK